TATFNFNGGTLQAQADQTAGNGWFETATSGNFQVVTTTVKSGGAKIDTNGFTTNINTVLAHDSALGGTADGGLAKSGSGTLSLGGSNTYTGATTITNGTLALSGSGAINTSSGITINGSGAKFVQTSSVSGTTAITLTQGTLDGTGTVGAVTVGAGTGGIVANGNGNSNTKLTIGSLTFSGAATMNLRMAGDTNTTGGLTVTNGLTTPGSAGSITVNITPALPLLTGTTYNLIGYGSYTGNTTDFVFGGNTARKTGVFGNDTTNKFITLTVNGDTPKWTGLDSNNGVVGTTGANGNWVLVTGGTQTDYIQGDDVSFTDSASSKTVNISAANVSPASVLFNNSTGNDYTVGGSFGIAGTGVLIKNNTGAVTISTANSYTGGTTISAGTLTMSGNNNFGTGAVTVNGGTLTLSGSNSYSGGTNVNN